MWRNRQRIQQVAARCGTVALHTQSSSHAVMRLRLIVRIQREQYTKFAFGFWRTFGGE
jgi:hypothetical protein